MIFQIKLFLYLFTLLKDLCNSKSVNYFCAFLEDAENLMVRRTILYYNPKLDHNQNNGCVEQCLRTTIIFPLKT